MQIRAELRAASWNIQLGSLGFECESIEQCSKSRTIKSLNFGFRFESIFFLKTFSIFLLAEAVLLCVFLCNSRALGAGELWSSKGECWANRFHWNPHRTLGNSVNSRHLKRCIPLQLQAHSLPAITSDY